MTLPMLWPKFRPIPHLQSLNICAAVFATVLLLWADGAAMGDDTGGRHSSRHDAKIVRTMDSTTANIPGDHAATDAPAHPGGSLGGLYSRRSLIGGFASGFLGAGLLSFAFGHGPLAGLGSTASYLGLLCQLALIALLGRAIWRWWSGRNAPAFAGLSPRELADPYLRSRGDMHPEVEALADQESANSNDAPHAAVANSARSAGRG
jgi:hypothetical protein